ncbi:MAG: PKD domain-containing protein, partial [Bacteroidia bacterium]
GIVKVQHFKKITYQNIYPFIDVEFIFNQENSDQPFKYNFIIHPGGNINQIKLKYDGALKTSLNNDGSVLLKTNIGLIEEKVPYSYIYNELSATKTAHVVDVKFKSDGEENHEIRNVYGFENINYDHRKTLVIDPTPWATYFGSDKDEQGYDIVTDSTGNVLIIGRTTSTHSIATNGAFQTVFGSLTMPGSDAFILKMNASGNRIWSTFFGGSGEELGQGISTNNLNEIVICGVTYSYNMFTTVGAFKTTYSSSLSPPPTSEMFLAKFNQGGFIQWSTFFGGVGNETGGKVKFDYAGNICFVGTTESYNLIASNGAFKTINNGGTKDAFIAKFDTYGNRLWSTFYGGDSYDTGNDISIDKWNNIFLFGTTNSSSNIATTSVHKPTLGISGYDAFIVKFNEYGQRQFGSYFGGNNTEIGNSITVSDSGYIYIAGTTFSNLNLATVGAFQTVSSPLVSALGDGFIAKLDSNCMLLWSTYYGDSIEDVINEVVVNKKGNIYLIGTTNSRAVFASNIAHQQNSGGAHDVFVANFDNNGNRLWGTFYGGTGSDYGYGIWEDKEEYIYFTGSTGSSNGIATNGAFNSVPNFGTNAFVAKFSNNGALKTIQNNSFMDYQFIFKNSMADSMIGSTPTDGYGAFTYKWISSEKGRDSIYTDASGVNNLKDYLPGIVNKTTWYKRIVYSRVSIDTSSAKAVFTYDTLSNNKIFAQSTVCNGAKAFVKGDNVMGGFGLSYKWLISTVDSISGFTIASGLNTGVDYIFVPSANKVWLKRVAYSLNKSDTSNTVSITVINAPHPKIGYFINNISQCLSNNHFVFTDTSTVNSGTLTRKWFSNDSIFETSNNVLNKNFVKAGLYILKLVIETNLGCKDSLNDIFAITLHQTNVSFDINQKIQCKQNEFLFSDNTVLDSSGHEVYFRYWHLGNGEIDSSNFSNIKKTYQPGNYTVKLFTKTYFGCIDSFEQSISVSSFDKPIVGFINNIQNQCLNNNSFSFIDTSISLVSSIIREWSFGDSTFSADSINLKRYQNDGNFIVKLKVTNGNNCADSITKQIQVYQLPKPLIAINNSEQCLIGNNFIFKDTSGLNYSVYWDLGDSTNRDSIIVNKIYNKAGKYEIKLFTTDSNNCKDTLIKNIEVFKTPIKPIITKISNTELSCTLANYYQWHLNDTLLLNKNTQNIQINKNGKYTVQNTDSNGCFSFSDSLIVRTVSVVELDNNKVISVYPNPFSDVLEIDLKGFYHQSIFIQLSDVLGKNIFTENIKPNSSNTYSLNTSSFQLTKGIYILKVNNDFFKVIKE